LDVDDRLSALVNVMVVDLSDVLFFANVVDGGMDDLLDDSCRALVNLGYIQICIDLPGAYTMSVVVSTVFVRSTMPCNEGGCAAPSTVKAFLYIC